MIRILITLILLTGVLDWCFKRAASALNFSFINSIQTPAPFAQYEGVTPSRIFLYDYTAVRYDIFTFSLSISPNYFQGDNSRDLVITSVDTVLSYNAEN